MRSRASQQPIADLAYPRARLKPLTPEERAAADLLAARELATAKLSIAEYVRAHAALLRRLVETAEGRERVRESARLAGSLAAEQRAPDADRIRAGTMEKYSPRRRRRAS